MDEWLTLEEFAKHARLHLDTARRYVREGKLPARRIGKRYLVKAADAEAFMENAPTAGPAPMPEVQQSTSDVTRAHRRGRG
jgi:excisionase family DNA binding protein